MKPLRILRPMKPWPLTARLKTPPTDRSIFATGSPTGPAASKAEGWGDGPPCASHSRARCGAIGSSIRLARGDPSTWQSPPAAARANHIDDLAELDLPRPLALRSEEHTSELQSLMRSSYAVFCLKKKTTH